MSGDGISEGGMVSLNPKNPHLFDISAGIDEIEAGIQEEPKPKPQPKFNRSHYPKWAKYIAMKDPGVWWWYYSKPVWKAKRGIWKRANKGDCGRIHPLYAPSYKGTAKDSLTELPPE